MPKLNKLGPVVALLLSFNLMATTNRGHSLDEKLDGPQSEYTSQLLNLVKTWPVAREFCHAKTEPEEVQTMGITTPERPYYVGFQKCMIIHAPIEAVEAVKDDVEHYKDLFPGFKNVRVVSKEGNKTVLAWEREIPVVFVNIQYQINYLVDKSTPGRAFYRYQFKGGDRIKFNDGIEVLEAQSDGTTLFTNFEFYEADYALGVLGIQVASAEHVWQESLKGSYLSIFSIRLKAEHPDWSYDHIDKERQVLLTKVPLDRLKLSHDFRSLASTGG
jgi:hypothetical protein